MKKIFPLVLVLACTLSASSQERRYTITPFIGYGTGGEFRLLDTQLLQEPARVDMVRSGVFGVSMELNRADGWDLQLHLRHQKSRYEETGQLFSEEPAGDFPPGETDVLDVRMTHLHVGILKELRPLTLEQRERGGIEPYIATGIGFSYLEDEIPLKSSGMIGISAAAGLTLYTSENFGFRLETRGYALYHGSGRSVREPITNRDCTGECVRIYEYPDWLYQADLTLGVSWGYDRMPLVDRMRDAGRRLTE